jgi:hypothetical protein
MQKLEIVNHLLQTVGERRVVSLTTGNPSVVQAVQALDGYDTDFQSKGWYFNTNRAVELTQSSGGEVLVPDSCLEVIPTSVRLANSSPMNKVRYAQRGNRIYDSWKNTYTIGHALIVDMVVRLPVEELPTVAAVYLKHMAAEQYAVDDEADMIKIDKLQQRTMLAFHNLKAAQLKAQAINALDSPAAQQMRYRIGQHQGSNPMLPGGRFS